MHYLYILLCDKAIFYTGITNNISKRLSEHKLGQSPHTKRYKEIDLVYKEEYESRFDAEKREKQIKGWSKKKKIALITGDIDKLKNFSSSKS